jgi:asparagine synthase (glutamine-hydrolysing)
MIRDRGRYRWFRDPSFLTHDAIGLCEGGPEHPWFAVEPASMLPGKRAHVASLVRVQDYLDAVEPSRAVPVVAPLVARPVMEACLSVPTWAWCEGGLNRAVARRAFASMLPPMITERRGKGSPDAFDAQVVTVHRTAIREMLLDGMLVQHGLVEPGAIDVALARPGPMRGTTYLRISRLVDVEAWLQSWSGRRCGGESLHA